jgi:hypothetical protein
VKDIEFYNKARSRLIGISILFGLLTATSVDCNLPMTSHGMRLKKQLKAARWQMKGIRQAEEDHRKQNQSQGYVELSRLVSGNAKFDGKQYYAEGYGFRVILNQDGESVSEEYFIVGVPRYKDRLPYGLIMNERGNIWIFDYPYPFKSSIPDSYTELEQFLQKEGRECPDWLEN